PSPGGGSTTQPDRIRPTVTISLPTCPKRLKRASCKRRRSTLGAWRTVRGTAKDAGGIRRVTLTAKRTRTRKVRAKTVRATATRRGTRWTAKVKGLTTGRWTFTVVATDEAGNRSKAVRRTVTLRRRA
ncbi:MAG: hypothetical protein H0V81_04920, partial [Solirubrobacterales bacterium]|nr:hypothetical protein [Solirubrobacterales bacterium]